MSAGFPQEISDGMVVLRQWKPEDFPFYAAYLADESTARFYGGKVDGQKAWRHLASLIGHWTLRGFGVYAVASSGTGELQGRRGNLGAVRLAVPGVRLLVHRRGVRKRARARRRATRARTRQGGAPCGRDDHHLHPSRERAWPVIGAATLGESWAASNLSSISARMFESNTPIDDDCPPIEETVHADRSRHDHRPEAGIDPHGR